jgi:hypothetical protein
MNKVLLNVVSLNHVALNLVGNTRRGASGGGGGGSDIPEGYEAFLALDGAFSAADGEFYVKL